MRRYAPPATTVAALLLTAACGSSSADAGPSASSGETPGPVAVVASTDVWGDVATQVGGDRVRVTSLISDPNQDPHSFEASTQTQLAVSKARIVIENGGGYDDFVDRMLASSKSGATVVNAVTVSGRQATGSGGLNEHVFYDLPAVEAVAQAVASEVTRADPGSAGYVAARTRTFVAGLHALEAAEQDIRQKHEGTPVAITEPVPGYLLEAAGLVNRTPEAFSEAVEEGSDVSPAVLAETLALVRDHSVSAVFANSQTSGPTTEQLVTAAREAGVPVVRVTETLPAGKDFLDWMRDNIAATSTAVSRP